MLPAIVSGQIHWFISASQLGDTQGKETDIILAVQILTMEDNLSCVQVPDRLI